MNLDAEMSQLQWLALKDRALGAAAEGITIADARLPERPLIYVNEGFERLTGYSADEVIGRSCRFLQGDDSDPETVAIIRAALDGQHDCSLEIRNYRKDGTPFWNRLSITPVRDQAGTVTHFIGIQSDVTKRREAEEALQEANAIMQHDLDEAAKVQQAWLPKTMPEVEGFDFAWTFTPCTELGGRQPECHPAGPGPCGHVCPGCQRSRCSGGPAVRIHPAVVERGAPAVLPLRFR